RELGPAVPVQQPRENRLENVLGILAAFHNAVCRAKDHHPMIAEQFVEVLLLLQDFIFRGGRCCQHMPLNDRTPDPPICYMSAKKIAVYRTCEALITRTRTAESRFSVILTFWEGCTATDADVSEQAARHASTAEDPQAQRRTSAHSHKPWSAAADMQSGRRVHEHECVLASRAAFWRAQVRAGE